MNKCVTCYQLMLLQKNILFQLLWTIYSLHKLSSSSFSFNYFWKRKYMKHDMFMTYDFLDLHTLGILSHSQPNGLAVPDATMQPVKSTSDVIKLMDIGLKNRAKGSTAMNERSSRSHRFVFSLSWQFNNASLLV